MADKRDAVELLEQFRDDLRRIVRCRLDSRLSGRFDESDIVQEVLMSATKELPAWKNDPGKSVFACLYQLTRTTIARVHRDHLARAKRAVHREEISPGITDQSALCLAERLMGREVSPSENVWRREIQTQVREALEQLRESDREVLIMRVLEGIPAREVGEILGISADAVNMRQLRALQRLRPLLQQFEE